MGGKSMATVPKINVHIKKIFFFVPTLFLIMLAQASEPPCDALAPHKRQMIISGAHSCLGTLCIDFSHFVREGDRCTFYRLLDPGTDNIPK